MDRTELNLSQIENTLKNLKQGFLHGDWVIQDNKNPEKTNSITTIFNNSKVKLDKTISNEFCDFNVTITTGYETHYKYIFSLPSLKTRIEYIDYKLHIYESIKNLDIFGVFYINDNLSEFLDVIKFDLENPDEFFKLARIYAGIDLLVEKEGIANYTKRNFCKTEYTRKYYYIHEGTRSIKAHKGIDIFKAETNHDKMECIHLAKEWIESFKKKNKEG